MHLHKRVREEGGWVGVVCMGTYYSNRLVLLFLLSFRRKTLIPSSLQLYRREAALERSEVTGPDRMSADGVSGPQWQAVEVERTADIFARLVEATFVP